MACRLLPLRMQERHILMHANVYVVAVSLEMAVNKIEERGVFGFHLEKHTAERIAESLIGDQKVFEVPIYIELVDIHEIDSAS